MNGWVYGASTASPPSGCGRPTEAGGVDMRSAESDLSNVTHLAQHSAEGRHSETMDWLAPTFGLLGTVVGGLLTAFAADRAERRRTRRDARAVAVLLRDELAVTDHRIAEALKSGIWGAVLDPGLPYASGLWAVEHREGHREPSVWSNSRDRLAPYVPTADWETIARPYLLISTLCDRRGVWTDDPSREFLPGTRQDLESVREAIAAAHEVLARVIESARS